MKKSLAYLPKNKRHDLRQIVELVREEIRDVEMIILYGSYARGTYVDYDQRIEFGVPTYFMSDYDILIVTERHIPKDIDENIYDRIYDRFYKHKNRDFYTSIQFINESIGDFNRDIDKGRYFYTDIKKEGVMLYDSGKYKLARRRRLNYTEIRELAQEYFADKFASGEAFLDDAKTNYTKGRHKQASFHLHQATENFLRTIPLVYILYGHKDHNLRTLLGYAKKHTLEICKLFPRDTDEEKRLFKLLQAAYVQARYNKNFVVAKEDIDALMPRIEMLRDITDKVCREKIAEYETLGHKPEKRK